MPDFDPPTMMTRPPTMEDADAAVEAQATAMEKAIALQAPTGKYTPDRYRGFAGAIGQVLPLLVPGKEPAFDLNLDFKNSVKMPTDLAAAYLSLVSAEKAYAAATDMEVTLPAITTLTTDGAMAMAMGALKKLSSSKPFQKWAKENVQPLPNAEEEPSVSDDAASQTLNDPELKALFG